MQKVGIAGHSLGGATAAQFCHDDPRCAAGIDIDGMPFGNVIQDGIHRPFLFLMSDHSRESGSEPQTVERNIESIYDHVPEGKRWGMTIIGANHFTFSDQMFTKSPILMFFLRRVGVMGSLEKRRGLAITGACVHTFFDVYPERRTRGGNEQSARPLSGIEDRDHHGVPTSTSSLSK
jgi:hypothetical protein